MRDALIAGLLGTVALTLAIPPVAARPEGDAMRASDVARALKGKVCTTRGGATFAFGKDGHYAYDGMWTDHGHYSVHNGAVTVLLDSGLERDFAISRRDGVLYLEETAVSCA